MSPRTWPAHDAPSSEVSSATMPPWPTRTPGMTAPSSYAPRHSTNFFPGPHSAAAVTATPCLRSGDGSTNLEPPPRSRAHMPLPCLPWTPGSTCRRWPVRPCSASWVAPCPSCGGEARQMARGRGVAGWGTRSATQAIAARFPHCETACPGRRREGGAGSTKPSRLVAKSLTRQILVLREDSQVFPRSSQLGLQSGSLAATSSRAGLVPYWSGARVHPFD